MLGPIDYVVVGFKGNNFDGTILEELGKAVDSGNHAFYQYGFGKFGFAGKHISGNKANSRYKHSHAEHESYAHERTSIYCQASDSGCRQSDT